MLAAAASSASAAASRFLATISESSEPRRSDGCDLSDDASAPAIAIRMATTTATSAPPINQRSAAADRADKLAASAVSPSYFTYTGIRRSCSGRVQDAGSNSAPQCLQTSAARRTVSAHRGHTFFAPATTSRSSRLASDPVKQAITRPSGPRKSPSKKPVSPSPPRAFATNAAAAPNRSHSGPRIKRMSTPPLAIFSSLSVDS